MDQKAKGIEVIKVAGIIFFVNYVINLNLLLAT